MITKSYTHEGKEVKDKFYFPRHKLLELMVGFEEEGIEILFQEIMHCTHGMDIIC